MGLDEFGEEQGSIFSRNKWIIIAIIVIIILIVNITLFIEFLPGGSFFSEIGSTGDKFEKEFTVVGNSGGVTDGESIDTPNTPQKIGSVTVSAGSMEQIEIKG
jgi:hypothetical protein